MTKKQIQARKREDESDEMRFRRRRLTLKRHEKLEEFYKDGRTLLNEGEISTWVNTGVYRFLVPMCTLVIPRRPRQN